MALVGGSGPTRARPVAGPVRLGVARARAVTALPWASAVRGGALRALVPLVSCVARPCTPKTAPFPNTVGTHPSCRVEKTRARAQAAPPHPIVHRGAGESFRARATRPSRPVLPYHHPSPKNCWPTSPPQGFARAPRGHTHIIVTAIARCARLSGSARTVIAHLAGVLVGASLGVRLPDRVPTQLLEAIFFPHIHMHRFVNEDRDLTTAFS